MNTSADNGNREHEFFFNVPGFRDRGVVYFEYKPKTQTYEAVIYGGFDCEMLEVFHHWGPGQSIERTRHWNIRIDAEVPDKNTFDPRKEFVKGVIEEFDEAQAEGEDYTFFNRLELRDKDKWLEIWRDYVR